MNTIKIHFKDTLVKALIKTLTTSVGLFIGDDEGETDGLAVVGLGVGFAVLGGGVGAGPLSNPYSISPFHTRGEYVLPNSPPAPLPS